MKKISAQERINLDLGKANEKQAQFYASRSLYTAYGGARGGGKSHAVRIKAICGALNWEKIKILIVRRTYPDLENSIITPLVRALPEGIASYNSTQHTLRFINGSTIKFGHFQRHSGAGEYQGQEYDWIFIDEATQFSEDEFRILGGCLRGATQIPKRMYITCNPGGIGHQWVKRLFIDRRFRRSENPEEDENPEDYRFIPATVEDNEVLLKHSPQYLKMLSALPENIRRAHRYGDWDALGGAYFPEFERGVHTCAPFAIPERWVRYRAFDYGLDMLACYWIAVDYEGKAWVYRELKKSGLIVSEAAELIRSMTLPQEQIAATFAPPDMWSTQKDTGKTMAEVFTINAVPLLRANNNRVQGWLQVKEYLRQPKLVIFDDCRGLIEDMQAIQADENNPNDCAKQPHEVTHSCDAIRYFCQSRSLPAEAAQEENCAEDEEELYSHFMAGGEISEGYLNY